MTRRHTTSWLLAAWAVLCAPGPTILAGYDDAPPAQLSSEELKAGIARVQAKIRSFRVNYEIAYPTGEGWPTGTYLRRTVAAMAPVFFFHETSHGHAKLAWSEDFKLRRCYVVGDHAIDEWVNNRSYNYTKLEPGEGLPGSMPGEFFIHATGLWPLDGRPAPRFQSGPLVLREIATSELYHFVRPRQEHRDGAWCHVLERPGVDSLWIDPLRGFALMGREAHNKDSGHLAERLEMGGHRQVKPGVWLPSWIHNTQYDYKSNEPERRQRKVVDARINLIQLDLNDDVETDIFRFQPPAGALWLDPPRGHFVQTSPGGEDQLDRIVKWSRRYSPENRTQFWRGVWRVPLVCLLVGVATSILLLRFRSALKLP